MFDPVPIWILVIITIVIWTMVYRQLHENQKLHKKLLELIRAREERESKQNSERELQKMFPNPVERQWILDGRARRGR
jgi:hypothetical protein